MQWQFEISTSKKEFVKNALINCKTYQKRACSIFKMMCLHFTMFITTIACRPVKNSNNAFLNELGTSELRVQSRHGQYLVLVLRYWGFGRYWYWYWYWKSKFSSIGIGIGIENPSFPVLVLVLVLKIWLSKYWYWYWKFDFPSIGIGIGIDLLNPQYQVSFHVR